MNEPTWLVEAKKYIGEKEYPGMPSNPWIVSLWKKIKRSGIKDDSTPWCAAFVGGCLEAVGVVSSRYESAKSYLAWGVPLSKPTLGCVVVFERQGGGHVGFVVGEDPKGRLMVLGGNQGNVVSIAPFDRSRVAGYRWPATVWIQLSPLPLILSAAQSSTNEA